ncbi:MAG: sulfatase [Myxococcota bacterium]
MIIAWLLACGDDKAPALPGRAEARVELGTPSGSLVWRGMDALAQAEIALPEAAAAPRTDGRFELVDGWTKTSRRVGRLRVFTRALPFPSDMPKPNYAPMGARLFHGGDEIPYVNDADDLRGAGWYVDGGKMKVLSLEDPAEWSPPPRLEVPELAAAVARRDGGAGTALERVVTEVTNDKVTREGMHLPAGGCATFSVDVPKDATLEFGLVPLPDPLGQASAEPAVRAIVRAGDTVVHDSTVEATHAWRHVDEPLAEGKATRLSFCAEAEGPGHVVFTNPVVRAKPTRPPRRVVLIGIDTLRRDALGVYGYERDTSPALDRWADQMVVFDDAYAPAPRTRPSFRTALTGRYPLEAVRAPTLAERLRPLGFRTGGIVANVHLVPRFGFNDGFETWHYDNGAKAEEQVDRALAWLDRHADEDGFLFLHLMDPHTWYNAPAPYGDKFQTGSRPKGVPEVFDRWQIWQTMKRPGFGDEQKRWVRAAYDGEVAYMTDQLARLFAKLDALPGETLTIVHSDHGEEFWDHDGYEHNHSLYGELVRAVLLIRPPGGWTGGPHRVDAPVGLHDIVPTVLDAVDAPQERVDGTSLLPYAHAPRFHEREALTATLRDRPLWLGHLMFDTERWGVVWGGAKYVLHTWSGREELYDLEADPGETRDLAADEPERLAGLREALERVSGWPVRPGWRLEPDGARLVPFRLEFEGPIEAAGFLDPEAARKTRSNLEWGEKPPLTVDDLGTVRLSADRRVASVTLRTAAREKVLYVTCAGPCPAGKVVSAEGEAPLAKGRITLGSLAIRATPGTVQRQLETEEDVLGTPESSQLEALELLGYVEPDGD